MSGMNTDSPPSTAGKRRSLDDVPVEGLHSESGAIAESGQIEVAQQHNWDPHFEEKLVGWEARRVEGVEELHEDTRFESESEMGQMGPIK
ncbi:UNVERIFIED_CONTAM: hypothetical protein K2H54_048150 [Gekko kuhli]